MPLFERRHLKRGFSPKNSFREPVMVPSEPSKNEPPISYEEAITRKAILAVENAEEKPAFEAEFDANPREVMKILPGPVIWRFALSAKPEDHAFLARMVKTNKDKVLGSVKPILIETLSRHPHDAGAKRVFAGLLSRGHLDGRWVGSFIQAVDEARLRNTLPEKDYVACMGLVGTVFDKVPEALRGISDAKIASLGWETVTNSLLGKTFASAVKANPKRVAAVLSSGPSSATLFALAVSNEPPLSQSFDILMESGGAPEVVKAVRSKLSVALVDNPKDQGTRRVFGLLADRGHLGPDWIEAIMSNVDKIHTKGGMSGDQYNAFRELAEGMSLLKRPLSVGVRSSPFAPQVS